MDVQHTRRWQNRDVAFLMDSALLEKKRKEERKRGSGGRGEEVGWAVILWKTRFVFDCVGARHRQDAYCTCKKGFHLHCYETGSMLESDPPTPHRVSAAKMQSP